jgi:hypothetical protein
LLAKEGEWPWAEFEPSNIASGPQERAFVTSSFLAASQFSFSDGDGLLSLACLRLRIGADHVASACWLAEIRVVEQADPVAAE